MAQRACGAYVILTEQIDVIPSQPQSRAGSHAPDLQIEEQEEREDGDDEEVEEVPPPPAKKKQRQDGTPSSRKPAGK